MLLTMLRAIYDVRREAMPELLQVALNRTVPALLGITHGDGGIGSWQGSGAVSDLLVEAVIKASGVRSRPLRQARAWGDRKTTRLNPRHKCAHRMPASARKKKQNTK